MKKLFISLIAILVIASLFFLSASFLGTDDKRILDDDLHVKRLNLAAESNACTFFLAAAKTLHLTNDVYYNLTESIKSNVWDEAVISGLLATNEAMLSVLDRGLKCTACECPAITNVAQSVSYMSPWRSMARVMSVKTRWLFHCGRQEEAFENAVNTVRFGHMIEQGSDNLIQWLVGIAITGIGLEDIERMAGSCALPVDKLKQYAETLAGYAAGPEGLINVFRGEYQVVCLYVDDLSQGKTTLKELLSIKFFSIPVDERKQGVRFHIPSYMLHPQRTKMMCGDIYRKYIKEVPKNYVDVDKKLLRRDDSESNEIWRIAGPNGLGRFLLNMLTVYQGSVIEKRHRANTNVAGTRLLLALKAFRQDKNRLPESLDELTPAYLKNIPEDPYDGKPMRYSSEKRVVYSVGKDLKDSGGSNVSPPSIPTSSYTNRWTTEDVVFKVEF